MSELSKPEVIMSYDHMLGIHCTLCILFNGKDGKENCKINYQ